eukprot:snap_masked-scaffold_38-processed-gene-2.42-mRNA-1 protein AED:1.00 eAED:1.00 QI:0/0/0/0/1/1/2/0/194
MEKNTLRITQAVRSRKSEEDEDGFPDKALRKTESFENDNKSYRYIGRKQVQFIKELRLENPLAIKRLMFYQFKQQMNQEDLEYINPHFENLSPMKIVLSEFSIGHKSLKNFLKQIRKVMQQVSVFETDQDLSEKSLVSVLFSTLKILRKLCFLFIEAKKIASCSEIRKFIVSQGPHLKGIQFPMGTNFYNFTKV